MSDKNTQTGGNTEKNTVKMRKDPPWWMRNVLFHQTLFLTRHFISTESKLDSETRNFFKSSWINDPSQLQKPFQ